MQSDHHEGAAAWQLVNCDKGRTEKRVRESEEEEEGVVAHLPEHLIYRILLNLPVKFLLQCCCLSKQWNEIIRSPDFGKDHLLNHQQQSQCIILLTDHPSGTCESWLYPELDHEGTVACPRYNNGKLRLPFFTEEIIGQDRANSTCGLVYSSSCHGLLCTAYYYYGEATIFVWNPSTGKFRKISWPEQQTTKSYVFDSFVGFGYDAVVNDYKIVVYTHDSAAGARTTKVMSFKTNMWRSIDGPPLEDGHVYSSCPQAIDGDVYWVARSRIGNISQNMYWRTPPIPDDWCFLLLKFNLTEEKFTIVPPPPLDHSNVVVGLDKWRPWLEQCKGSLCFLHGNFRKRQIPPPQDPSTMVHVWTLDQEENGGPATWNRSMCIPYVDGGLGSGEVNVVGLTGNGDFIMTRPMHDKLVIYRQQTDSFTTLQLDGRHQPPLICGGRFDLHILQTESLI